MDFGAEIYKKKPFLGGSHPSASGRSILFDSFTDFSFFFFIKKLTIVGACRETVGSELLGEQLCVCMSVCMCECECAGHTRLQ